MGPKKHRVAYSGAILEASHSLPTAGPSLQNCLPQAEEPLVPQVPQRQGKVTRPYIYKGDHASLARTLLSPSRMTGITDGDQDTHFTSQTAQCWALVRGNHLSSTAQWAPNSWFNWRTTISFNSSFSNSSLTSPQINLCLAP